MNIQNMSDVTDTKKKLPVCVLYSNNKKKYAKNSYVICYNAKKINF